MNNGRFFDLFGTSLDTKSVRRVSVRNNNNNNIRVF